ncbi:MAG: GNAT family N-acetyltransferase [Nitrosomonas sp.]|nr:MAG: GNAT family N-acetyltransferase [Nitrosomonas sp.]
MKGTVQPQVLPLAITDTMAVSRLANTIWRHHYSGIISERQIDYMLQQRYRPELIRVQLPSTDIWWRKLLLNDEIIGFSCYVRTAQPAVFKIDKLYIHCDHHRKGYGALMIADAIALMREHHFRSLILTVNKRNHTAIAAYRYYGFEVVGDSKVDIGGGFFMDDYLMRLVR